MTETPGQPDNPTPEQPSNETTEPVLPPVTGAPTAPPADVTSESHTRRNRIAASVALAAGAVAIVAASFTGGLVVGTHEAADGAHQAQWGRQHSQVAAYPRHAPAGQIWVIPGGGPAQGQGFIITESG